MGASGRPTSGFIPSRCSYMRPHVRPSSLEQRPLRYAIVDGLDVRDSRVHNYPPRWMREFPFLPRNNNLPSLVELGGHETQKRNR
jgi:hypothetical protein